MAPSFNSTGDGRENNLSAGCPMVNFPEWRNFLVSFQLTEVFLEEKNCTSTPEQKYLVWEQGLIAAERARKEQAESKVVEGGILLSFFPLSFRLILTKRA